MSHNTETAILAGGCFWGVQELLRHRDGVISTRVGYTGGANDNPTYGDHPATPRQSRLCSTPLASPTETSWSSSSRSTTQRPRTAKANDIGSSYRSEIFYLSDAQRHVAEDTIAEVNASGIWPGKVVTEVTDAVA